MEDVPPAEEKAFKPDSSATEAAEEPSPFTSHAQQQPASVKVESQPALSAPSAMEEDACMSPRKSHLGNETQARNSNGNGSASFAPPAHLNLSKLRTPRDLSPDSPSTNWGEGSGSVRSVSLKVGSVRQSSTPTLNAAQSHSDRPKNAHTVSIASPAAKGTPARGPDSMVGSPLALPPSQDQQAPLPGCKAEQGAEAAAVGPEADQAAAKEQRAAVEEIEEVQAALQASTRFTSSACNCMQGYNSLRTLPTHARGLFDDTLQQMFEIVSTCTPNIIAKIQQQGY